MPYAKGTKVPPNKTRLEIENLVRKYGAKGFVGGWHEGTARVEFYCRDRHVRLTVETIGTVGSQAEREKWRALLLLVKSKLVAVDAKIATFEQAFVGDIVMPETGKTVWETVKAPIALSYSERKSVPLLGVSDER